MRKSPVGNLRELAYGRCTAGSGKKSKENDVVFHALQFFFNNLLLSFMSLFNFRI